MNPGEINWFCVETFQASFVFVKTQFVDPAGVAGGSTLPATSPAAIALDRCTHSLPGSSTSSGSSPQALGRKNSWTAGYGEGHGWKWLSWDPHFLKLVDFMWNKVTCDIDIHRPSSKSILGYSWAFLRGSFFGVKKTMCHTPPSWSVDPASCSIWLPPKSWSHPSWPKTSDSSRASDQIPVPGSPLFHPEKHLQLLSRHGRPNSPTPTKKTCL